jgi:hypothetical protein
MPHPPPKKIALLDVGIPFPKGKFFLIPNKKKKKNLGEFFTQKKKKK